MWFLSVRVDVSWETFLLFSISWKFGFATHLITTSIILLLFLFLWVSCSQYTTLSGVTDLGTSSSKRQSSLVVQPQAITQALVILAELGAWMWVKQTRRRQTVTSGEELGQAPGRLPPAPRLPLSLRPPHQLTMSQDHLPGLRRALSSVSLQPLQAGSSRDVASVIFPSSVPKRGSDLVTSENDPMCKLLNNLLKSLTSFLQRVHIQDLYLGHDPFNEIKDRWKTETTGCSGGRMFGFNVCTLFPGSLRQILWF